MVGADQEIIDRLIQELSTPIAWDILLDPTNPIDYIILVLFEGEIEHLRTDAFGSALAILSEVPDGALMEPVSEPVPSRVSSGVKAPVRTVSTTERIVGTGGLRFGQALYCTHNKLRMRMGVGAQKPYNPQQVAAASEAFDRGFYTPALLGMLQEERRSRAADRSRISYIYANLPDIVEGAVEDFTHRPKGEKTLKADYLKWGLIGLAVAALSGILIYGVYLAFSGGI